MKLHLEITSKCALACPSCNRTQYKETLTSADLSLDVIKRNLDPKQKYRHILLSGNHGDPIYHSQFHELIRFLKFIAPSTPLIIATNGSHRSTEWWKVTAEILTSQDYVTFAIDGLEDTNHVYRKNADWPSIIEGIKVLKKYSKCIIQWQWILFKQNQYQVSRGVAFAKNLGVDRFFILESSRDNEGMVPTIALDEVSI